MVTPTVIATGAGMRLAWIEGGRCTREQQFAFNQQGQALGAHSGNAQYPYYNQFGSQQWQFPGQAQGQWQIPGQQQFGFAPGGWPQYPNQQVLGARLPLAQLQPLIQSRAVAGDTGPAAVAVVAVGAGAGLSWVRRKRRN